MQTKLLGWYDRNQRPLPWRLASPDPYKTWISEIMLQQTQVETVLPYFARFLEAFPDVESLAEAPLEAVLKHWSGLGYYSRARNLHQSARKIVREWGGRFPKTKKELLELPGIGEYTAGAIASIAFGERAPVVDGNVIRVLTRAFALAGDPKKKPLKQVLWKKAGDWVCAQRPGDFNQAMMELGAMVCLPKTPRCPICPLKQSCEAYRQKRVADYPTPQEKIPTEKVFLAAALIEKNGHYLLAKRDEKRHLQSMWEFPQIKLKNGKISEKQLTEWLQSRYGIEVEFREQLPMVRHAIMNRRIALKPFVCRHWKGRPKSHKEHVAFQWIALKDLKQFPMSSINHKIANFLQ